MTGTWFSGIFPGSKRPAEIDTTVAHPARVYDYWLGGKDNFAADREAAERVLAISPGLRFRVKANRAFLARSVRFLATDCDVRQFLDIGTGIPTGNNTHEVAQAAAPSSRIVYVDNDPIVLAHARALLTSTPEGATACLWSRRGWCTCTPGAPTPTTSRRPRWSRRTAAWRASPDRPQARTGHKPDRPQAGQATSRTGHKPDRPQAGQATSPGLRLQLISPVR